MVMSTARSDFVGDYLISTPAKVLCNIKEGKSYISQISKKMDMTLACISASIHLLIKCGLVKKEKVGRSNKLILTYKGTAVRDELLKIREIAERIKKKRK